MDPIARIDVSAFRVPTAHDPESDGTAVWNATTLVTVELEAGGRRGFGYTYADTATARLIADVLTPVVRGRSPFDVRAIFEAMVTAVRNHGRRGAAAMAISAVDNAVWDLKARLLDTCICHLLGMVRPAIPAYGSGGFTSFTEDELCEQLAGWARRGFRFVKMKVGREPEKDPQRVAAARRAIGPSVQLFVDANGAYARKQALAMAERFATEGVTWFEEPVVRTDLEGLRLLRDRAPATMEITGGEYDYEPADVLAQAQVLDVVQADVTRCGGITGFLDTHAICAVRDLPMSSHCAPAQHVALGCALPRMRHVEWFADHERIERMLLHGAPQPENGTLRPDVERLGNGLSLNRDAAERFRVPF